MAPHQLLSSSDFPNLLCRTWNQHLHGHQPRRAKMILSSRPKHDRNTAQVARSMRAMEVIFDVVFLVEGQQFPAHRIWLASASPMLRSMLTAACESHENARCRFHISIREPWSVSLTISTFRVSMLVTSSLAWSCANVPDLEH